VPEDIWEASKYKIKAYVVDDSVPYTGKVDLYVLKDNDESNPIKTEKGISVKAGKPIERTYDVPKVDPKVATYEFSIVAKYGEGMAKSQQLADAIPWKVGEKVSQADRLAASDNIANMLGINAASKGGLGVRGSTDYTRIAELAQMWEKHPQWFSKTDAESWPNYVERLSSQVSGLSMKTGSFGGVWQDPAHAGVSAIDRHMVNEFERTGNLFKSPAEKEAFEKRAVERWNNANEGKPVENYGQLPKAS